MSTATQVPPRVWIGCLAAYNSGRIHGRWVDATDLDAMRAAQSAVVQTSPARYAEETFLADYEGFPSRYVGEYTPLDTVHALAVALVEHGITFAAFVDSLGLDVRTPEEVEKAVAAFEDAYLGEVQAGTLEKAVGEYILDGAREVTDLATLEADPWHVVVDVEATGQNYMGEITGERVAPGLFALWRVV